MENFWILFIFIHSFLKGTRDGMQKAALKKNSSAQVLFYYSLIGFIMILPFSKNAFSLEPVYIFYTFIKSAVVCVAWIFGYMAIKNLSVSLYGVIDMSRMLFTTLLGMMLLGENLTLGKVIGIVLVITGLYLANKSPDENNGKAKFTAVLAALINCLLISVSSTMDKVLMKNIEAGQLQFWFMFFVTLFYGAIIISKKENFSPKAMKGNWWIPLMSLSLVFGDRLLFKANASPFSEVSSMAIIKQSAVFFSILTGWIFYKEKRIIYKLGCSLIILAGIVISILVKI